MARKPYVPLNTEPQCNAATEKPCEPADRVVRSMISKDAGNSISQRPDGIYAPAVIYRENTEVFNEDGSIDIVETENVDGFRQFKVGIAVSEETGNIVEIKDDGLYVPEPAPEDLLQDILDEGTLTCNPLVPGQGIMAIPDSDRVAIRVLNSLIRLVLQVQTVRDRPQEVFLIQDVYRSSPMKLVWEAGVTVDNVAGPAEMDFSPASTISLVRLTGQNWLVMRAGAVPYDAPLDNEVYVRQNGMWKLFKKQVLPVLVTGTPVDVIPLEVSSSQFNRIVTIDSRYSLVKLKRQHIANYEDDFEATYIKNEDFTFNVPMGVTVNGVAGPLNFSVEQKPKGAVLKKISPDNWLLLGSVIQEGDELLPEVTVLEYPGSGTFQAAARLLDGTLLYDKGTNSTPNNTIMGLKNLIIACVICKYKTPSLTYKALTYNNAYATGITGTASGLATGDIISYFDAITLLVSGGFEDIAVMISSIMGAEFAATNGLGLTAHNSFTYEMNLLIGEIENPKISEMYGAAQNIANPVGQSTVYMLNNWLQYIEEHYSPIRTELRKLTTTISVFGVDARSLDVTNGNGLLIWANDDFGKLNNYAGVSPASFASIQKIETPSEIPVFLSVIGAATALERHLATTTAFLHLEDDFPFLTGTYVLNDDLFNDVSVLLGNAFPLIDRSSKENFVTVSPLGVTHQIRTGKGFGHSWDFNGTNGTVSVYDDPSIRLGSQNFTIEMVFRGKGPKTAFTLFGKYNASTNKRSYWCRINGTNLEFIYSLDGTTDTTVLVPLPAQAVYLNGARRNITIQRRGTSLEFFLNGLFVLSHAIGSGVLFDCDMPLNIGSEGNPLNVPVPVAGQYGLFILDNFRLSKGIARYPSTGFGCETTPFKNGSGT